MNKKKNRKENNTQWIYGKHAVKSVLLNKKRHIVKVVILESSKDFIEEIFSQHPSIKIPYELVDKTFFIKLFGKDATHQGCAILAEQLKEYYLEDVIADNFNRSINTHSNKEDSIADENNTKDQNSGNEKKENSSDDRPIIILDQVADPQNIGSILRASAVFGARAVIVTENHSPEMTPAIIKAASGAFELVPIVRVTNLVQAINTLKKHGFWTIGLDERANKKLGDIKLNGKFAFIIGNEGYGMRRLSKEACDFTVQLPCEESFSTLNAAQAATVTLYESCKQRQSNH